MDPSVNQVHRPCIPPLCTYIEGEMDPPSYSSIDDVYTTTPNAISRPHSQLSMDALYTTTLHIYIERAGRETPQSIEQRDLAFCYTAYIYIYIYIIYIYIERERERERER